MTEIECNVFPRGCLKKHVPDEESLCREVHALELERNRSRSRTTWRFGNQDARSKRHSLFPINS